MNPPDKNHLPDFIGQFQDTIRPLFRYHLARCGDWLSAEALTAEALRLGRDWYLAGGLDGEMPREWLFGLAVDVQARYRRARSLPSLPENGLTPTPDQMERFARMAVLAEAWHKLPPEQADALALIFFTGLSANEVFLVTGVEEAQLQPLAAAWHSRVGELAVEVQPVGYFEGHLLNTLREELPRKAIGKAPNRIRSAYRRGPFWRKLWRILGALVVLLVLSGAALYLVRLVGTQEIGGEISPGASPTLSEERVSKTVNFPASEDQAILMDEAGRIVRLDLNTNRIFYLTAEKFYSDGLPPEDASVLSISPDGNWLAIKQPTTYNTYLLRMDGKEQIALPGRIQHLDWAPDSRSVVYVDANSPTVVSRYQLFIRRSAAVATLPWEIITLACSPKGDAIVAMGFDTQATGSTQGESQSGQIIKINGQSGKATVMYDLEEQFFGGEPRYFLWANDGEELWYPWSMVGLPMDGRAPRSLFSFPENRWGIQNYLLFGGSIGYGLIDQISISPDLTKIVLVHEDTNGDPYMISLQSGQNFERNEWLMEIGKVERLAWTVEGHNLLAGRDVRYRSELLRVDARSGHSQVIADDVLLLGTLSSLRSTEQHRAPQTLLLPAEPESYRGPMVEATFPNLDLSFQVPAGWMVYSLPIAAPEGQNSGWAVVTNFGLANPLGFVSLGEDQLRFYVVSETRTLAEYQRDLEKNQENAEYEKINLNGLTTHRFSVRSEKGLWQTALIETPGGLVGVYPNLMTEEHLADFEGFLNSVAWIPQAAAPKDDPISITAVLGDTAAEPRESQTVRWATYQNDVLHFSFEVPAVYMERMDMDCFVRGEEVASEMSKPYFSSRVDYRVGYNTVLSVWYGLGDDLENFVERDVSWRKDWEVLHQEKRTLNGREVMLVEYQAGMAGINAYWIRGEDAYVLSIRDGVFCDFPEEGVREVDTFRRIVETLQWEEIP